MKLKTFPTLTGIAFGCAITFFSNAAVVVVVHPSNDANLDAKSIKRIYLGKENKFSSGKIILPVNQVQKSDVRGAFDEDILGRSSNQISAYWSKIIFTGKGVPPTELDNDAAVLAIVADNPNAIGYVNSASVSDAVKTISLN
jgi:ABC-type phosphate transport system substrate-binding protein